MKDTFAPDHCKRAAREYCEYYKGIRDQYEERRNDPDWEFMHEIAIQWEAILADQKYEEKALAEIESRLKEKWSKHECGTTWIAMASSIEAWLRHKGRKGLGPNPWFGDKGMDWIMALGFDHPSQPQTTEQK